MIVYQKYTSYPEKDHKLESRLEFPHLNRLTRRSYFKNHQSASQPRHFLKSLPREDVSKKECYSWLKHISLLVSLNHHRRTNNNRIINISQLVLLTCLAFMTLLILSTTAEAKKNASLEFDNLNAKAVQLHGSASSVLIPMKTSVSYSTAYSNSQLPPGFNKNKKRPGTVRNVSKFRKTLNRKNLSNNANDSSLVKPEKVIDDRSTIARPFFTKITSNDAIAKPSSYFDSIFKLPTTSSTFLPESSTAVSNASSKPSKLFTLDKATVSSGLTSATEKSFLTTSTVRNNEQASSFLKPEADSGPKIRLEPFFNLFSNIQSFALGTSKEKNFSPSYQTITQSINENMKTTKANKSTKGMREKKRKKLRNKSPKLDGPIPIPLPEQVVNPDELKDSHVSLSRSTNKSTLHPMDVLNIPMSPNPFVSDNSPFTETPLPIDDLPIGREAFDSHTFFSMDDARNSTFDSTRSYLGFDKYDKTNKSNNKNEGEGRLRSESIIDNFHDQDVDLQAEESVTMLQMDPSPTQQTQTNNRSIKRRKKPRRKGSRANIPSGYTTPTDIDAAHSHFTQQKLDPQGPYGNNEFNPIPGPPSLHYLPMGTTRNRIRDDLTMISKYPTSFEYNPGMSSDVIHDGSRPTFGPIPQNIPRITNHGLTNKLRPNLNSYYDPHYHNNPPNGDTNGFHSISNDYAHPHLGGSHYVEHTHFGQDEKGNIVIPPQTIPNKPEAATSDLETQGSSSDNTFDVDKVSNSNQKIGIMDSFDLFYTNYKVLTWATFFVVTSLALLALLVYLYVNNPPTEVVQARESYFSIDNLLGNPQILKFLSSLVESNKTHRSGRQKRKKFKNDSMQISTTDKIKKQL